MSRKKIKAISGSVFDDSTKISIVELCEVCCIDRKQVDEMIEEGILEPTGGGRERQRLPYNSVHRTRTVIHLQRDLGVNLAGAALALELLERIDALRSRLRVVQ